MVLIADGDISEFLAENPTNDPSGSIHAFFSFTGSNPDGLSHVRRLGQNLWGFEDLFGGGDTDFNDMVLQVEFQGNLTQELDSLTGSDGSTLLIADMGPSTSPAAVDPLTGLSSGSDGSTGSIADVWPSTGPAAVDPITGLSIGSMVAPSDAAIATDPLPDPVPTGLPIVETPASEPPGTGPASSESFGLQALQPEPLLPPSQPAPSLLSSGPLSSPDPLAAPYTDLL